MSVIRTFPFITNGGTPEGQRLQELSGIKRMDREFPAIDKLSTFVSADIRANRELESLFCEGRDAKVFLSFVTWLRRGRKRALSHRYRC